MPETDTARQSVALRALRPQEAPALTRCFERCYGQSYVAREFYDPAELRARLEDGRLRSVVAVAPDGEIVGHMGLTLRHPGAKTVDAGNTVVDPRYRNQKLAGRIGLALIDACRDAGFVGFHHYPTTAHPILQKLAVQGGGIETGIMLSYIPSGTEYRELEEEATAGRLAVVVVYQPLATAPAREVFLPARYAPQLAPLLDQCGLERHTRPAPSTPPAGATRLEHGVEASRGLERVLVRHVGVDVADAIERACAGGRAHVVQVDLPLADPGVGFAAEALRRTGFFYCALMPEYLDGDSLRLQRLRERPLLPELVSEEARALLAFALADRGEP